MGTFPVFARAGGTWVANGTAARIGRVVALCGVGLLVANCNGGSKLTSKIDPKYGVSASPRVVAAGQPVPKGGGTYRVGKPYVVAGKTYVPTESTNYRAEGLASWYGDDFHGRLTANGEVFDMHSIAAAHPTLPMPSYVRVTNMANGRSMVVRVNDRGPYHGNRVIDVSQRAADLLGFKNRGTARVRVEYVGRAPLEGSDDIQLASTLRQNGQPAQMSGVMVASAGSMRGVAPAGDVPVPSGRPFDLGNGDEMASAPTTVRTAAMAPARVASKPRPAPVVAAAPAPRAAPAPAPVVQVASLQPPVRAPKPAPAAAPAQGGMPAGWVVGPQPVLGYAEPGAEMTADSGRGLY
ncbi:septal ring lytic transglycosylase RlpA family protein [Starkeya sp. 3C]|uniref:Endolytic peptidoglycan transglycosylase RlpA n=1 Tax=Ancylobacter moscoviensis TaxID=2597768 RepID=A0ABY3DPK5_9HYPH|nr:septal ring lytic transglycosylase RlpA family protein [Ancylobacter moscoviensis]